MAEKQCGGASDAEMVRPGGRTRPTRSIAFISASAYSLAHFKGTLIRSLAEAGVEVTAYAPDFEDAARAEIRALGATPLPLALDRSSISPLVLLSEVRKLQRALSKDPPDAVFACFLKPTVVAVLAARLAGIRLRYSSIEGLGYYFIGRPDRRRSRAILRGLLTFTLRLAIRMSTKVFFFNSRDPQTLLGPEWRLAPNLIQVTGGVGLDLARFAVAELPDRPSFVFVGRLLPEKGLSEFVEAARRVKAQYPLARFVVVGGTDRDQRSVSAALLRQWKMEAVVEWVGQVADVRPHIAQASVMVLPSYGEGAPRSIQEAMAMGRAIITTSVAGCEDMVRGRRNGILVPPREVGPLADAMLAFVRDPQLARRMGEESRMIACEEFDHIRIARFIQSHILEVPRR